MTTSVVRCDGETAKSAPALWCAEGCHPIFRLRTGDWGGRHVWRPYIVLGGIFGERRRAAIYRGRIAEGNEAK